MVTGETGLIGGASPEELEKLKGLFDAFQQKRDILDLVDRCIRADGVQIFIGDEAGYEALGDFSVITAPYQAGGQTLGVLGRGRADADGVRARDSDRRSHRADVEFGAEVDLNPPSLRKPPLIKGGGEQCERRILSGP